MLVWVTEQQECSFIVGGMPHGPASLEDSSAVSYKAKQSYHKIQQPCFLVFIQMSRKHLSIPKPAHMFIAVLFIVT